MSFKERYIGNKEFYKVILGIAVPIMIQNAISNFVGLLDNLMIGRLGTNALSGVAIGNQLIFVYFLMIFGATSGVGIFSAQYHGMGDVEGVRYTFRMKLVMNCILALLAFGILFAFTPQLVGLFLKGEGSPEDAAETLSIGVTYVRIILISLIPIALGNALGGTLRDTGETKVPMIASLIAVGVNLVGNLLLIYGLLGLPALGAVGAAIATVISRFVEVGVLFIYTITHKAAHPFIDGALRHFRIPGHLAGKFFLKSLPLMCNETLWAAGTTFLNQCYSYRSLSAVAAMNIEQTLWSLMGVAFLAMGEGVGIVVGQTLGKNQLEQAKKDATKMIAFTVACGAVFGIIMVLISPLFPMLYKTEPEIRTMATKLIAINGALMMIYAYTHASYFTIRAGGRTGITMIFDSCFVWVISVPTAFVLSRFTGIDVVLMYTIVQSLELIKCVVGGIMVNKGIWVRNIVGGDAGREAEGE